MKTIPQVGSDIPGRLARERAAIREAHEDLERLDEFLAQAEEANERLWQMQCQFMPSAALPEYRQALEDALKANLRLCICLGNEIEWCDCCEIHIQEAKEGK
jgi:phosphoglycolate phosphatase-like HAD superfamily hydrolase